MTHVFIAPHPDDVALSCGGLIASLRELGQNVAILTVFSGSGGSFLFIPPGQYRVSRTLTVTLSYNLFHQTGISAKGVSFSLPSRIFARPQMTASSVCVCAGGRSSAVGC